MDGNVLFKGTYNKNSVTGVYGGGVVRFQNTVNTGASVTFDGDFTENTATTIGGVAVFNGAVKGSVAFNGTYTENTASNSDGGVALFNAVSGQVTFNGTYTENSASNGGVAKFNGAMTGNVIFDGNFTDNYAKYHAGVVCFANTVSAPVTFNGTYTGNYAPSVSIVCFEKAVSNTITISGEYTDNTADTSSSIIELKTDSTNAVITFDHADLTDNTVNSNDDAFAIKLATIKELNIKNSTFTNDDIYVKSFTDYVILDNTWTNSTVSPKVELLDDEKFTVARNPGWTSKSITTIIIITPTGIFAGDDANITISIDPSVGAQSVFVNVTGLEDNTEVSLNASGVGSIVIPHISAGDYIVSVYFSGNTNYLEATETSEFTIKYPSFTDLQNLINSAVDTLNLSYDYSWISGEGLITISGDNLTINGNNHIIDAKQGSGIFKITGNNVTIANLTLTNAFTTLDGGAIVWNGVNGTIENTNFTNNKINSNTGEGAGIYAVGDNLTVTACNFEGNVANSGAGIAVETDNVKIIDSNFTSNSAFGNIVLVNGNNTTINSKFRKNSVSTGGETILINNNTSLTDCLFEDNVADYDVLINNNAAVDLEDNIIPNHIYLESGSISGANVTILGNTSVVAVIGETVNINATVFDDNGNIIELNSFMFVLDNGTVISDVVFTDDCYFANYTFDIAGTYTVNINLDNLPDCTVKTGTITIKINTDLFQYKK